MSHKVMIGADGAVVSAALVLGRDGMGPDADEADFDAWTTYVCERIDAATGLDVAVEIRGKRDVQDNGYRADDPDALRDAVNSLWDDFCADASAWPARTESSNETRDCLGLAVHAERMHGDRHGR